MIKPQSCSLNSAKCGKSFVARRAVGQHLVGGDGDRADLFALAGVLADGFGRQAGLVEDLADPLAGGDDRRRENQRLALQPGQHAQADDGLARAAGQHDHAAAAASAALGVKDIDRVLLVVAQAERTARSSVVSRRTISSGAPGCVAGQVLGRVAELEQRLLDAPALGRVDQQAA